MDKHGWAQATGTYAMEHQTIISYTGDFGLNNWGTDHVHIHELAHEWWGNFVTAKDWSDLWIHEGMATYMEALYVKHLFGIEKYYEWFADKPTGGYEHPLAPRTPRTAWMAFFTLDPYRRGSWVLHTLHYHLGDEKFYSMLKHWAYTDTSDTDNRNGRLCRLTTTDEMKDIAEQVTGVELDPFFEVFFRDTSLPYLKIERLYDETKFTWITETNVPLDLNVPVTVNGLEQYVEMSEGQGSIAVSQIDELVIDPNQWIFMTDPLITDLGIELSGNLPKEFNLSQNYPNPFNPTTKISFSIPKASFTTLTVYDLLGREIKTLVNEEKLAGNYEVVFDATSVNRRISSGVYFYRLRANDFTDVKKLLLLR